MVANPGHGELQSIFIAAFRRHIKEVVNTEQDVQSASVCRVSMKDVALTVFVKHAQSGRFIAGKVLHLIVVEHAVLRHFLWGKGNVEIAIETVLKRRDPLEVPSPS